MPKGKCWYIEPARCPRSLVYRFDGLRYKVEKSRRGVKNVNLIERTKDLSLEATNIQSVIAADGGLSSGASAVNASGRSVATASVSSNIL